MKKTPKKSHPQPGAGRGFDLTPMIDVVFLLIIFFMIVTDITNRKPRLQLPEAKEAEPDILLDRQRLVINIDAEGKIVTPRGALSDAALDRLLAAEAKVNRSRAVIIRADREARYGEVRKVMHKCRQHKLWKIAFATKDNSRQE